jgi:hypothetical protein
MMNNRSFAKPVYLWDRTHLVRQLSCVEDALDFLEEWPEEKRDIIYETALRACTKAYDGLVPAKVARDAMLGFGTKKGILEEPIVEPWMISKDPGGRLST